MWGIVRAFVVSVLIAAAMGASSFTASAATVLDVRAGVHGQTTRLVFDLSDPVDFKISALADPYRVIIDLPEVAWGPGQKPLPSNVGQMQKLRYGQSKPGSGRIVVETAGPAAVEKAFMIAPGGESKSHRLVVDLVPTSREALLSAPANPNESLEVALATSINALVAGTKSASAAPPPPAATPPAPVATPVAFPIPPRKPQQARSKKVIVIDPGHGGVDPGAVGISGIYEKEITLGVALAMRDAFVKSGRYKVVLTRDQDVFLPLKERVTVARDAGADLFISIHANTVKDARIRGLSVYTLSEQASDKEAAMLAEQENKADLIAGIDLSNESSEVTNILIDLAQREAMNQSSRFASLLVKEWAPTTSLLPNAHRFAGFAVLKAPDVPSVLVELGFLSNRQDEQSLMTKRYREKLASSALEAVDGYFSRVSDSKRR
jgi:N-acetylmuramoyl-L-alanine amidase